MHQITLNSKLLKEYPTIEQCEAWLIMNGYVNSVSGDWYRGIRLYLQDGIKIKEIMA